MFDAGNGSGTQVSATDPTDDRPRRQYTLKGVEAEAIDLMRDAAQKEGMKIGSWVSLRMKEAAERALVGVATPAKSSAGAGGQHASRSPEGFEQLLSAIWDQQERADQRLLQLERELHEITSGQRTILSALLASRVLPDVSRS